MRSSSLSGARPWAIAALLLSSTAAVACSGGDSDSGSGTQSQGGGGAATTTTGGSDGGGGQSAGCAACTAGQVCVGGACEDVSAHCPCMVETYCDAATDTCEIGCLAQSDCSPGRLCNAQTHACYDGCLTSAECESGFSCVGDQCLEGCGTTADCTVPGTVCTDSHCDCPAGQGLCSGSCAPLDSTSNCGACGVQCQPGYTCDAAGCTCPPGVCAPVVVIPPGVGKAYSFKLDGDYLYYYALMGPNGSGIFRVAKAGGTPALVTADPMTDFTVASGFVLYTKIIDGNSHTYNLMKVPVQGGSSTKLDAGPNATSALTALADTVYWFRSNNWYSLAIAGGGPHLLPSSLIPTGGVTATDAGLFWVSCIDANAIGCTVNRIYHNNNNQEVFAQLNNETFAQSAHELHVDAQRAHVATSDATDSIIQIPILGGPPVTADASDESHYYLTGDVTHLYWFQSGNSFQDIPGIIKRTPKAGGTASDFQTVPTYYSTALAIDDDHVYWAEEDGSILRRAK